MTQQVNNFRSRRRHGVIFITALGIILVLTGLLLAYAQEMRVESMASANRLSQLQADAIEQAAEQWVCAQVDLNATTGANGQPDSWTICDQTPAEAIQVGDGYFWLLRPDEDTDSQYEYGITDECSKLNLNSAYFTTNLYTTWDVQTDMTQDVFDAMLDWKNAANAASTDGDGESDYYNGITPNYNAKNLPYETVEEVLLVRGVTPENLFGMDTNRDGVISAAEHAAAGASSTNDSRGMFRYLTVYSTSEPGLAATAAGGAAAATTPPGRVNVNTASEAVLMSMGLTQQQADGIIQQRTSEALTDSTDVQSAMGSSASLTNFTYTSYHYSADIVAVSPDGRAFKRVRIVVSCAPAATAATGGGGGGGGGGATTPTPTTPSQIIYRRDLSDFGWPLPDEIRQQLRSGQKIAPQTGGAQSFSSLTVKPGVS